MRLRTEDGVNPACCGRGSAVRRLAPAALLVLIPKCPACLAGWLAVATGFGISMTAAGWLRAALIALCLAPLAFWAAQRVQASLASAFCAARLHGATVRRR
ncbi:MAG: hypothetical protein JST11_21610 [Acidobacteria bacterium]|nr:hypothetical protein [Acidobacteriota bacterium]